MFTNVIIVESVAGPDKASYILSGITFVNIEALGSVVLYSSFTSSKVFSIISFTLSTTSGLTAIAASQNLGIALSFSPPFIAMILMPAFWNTFNKIRPMIQFALARCL